MRDPARALVEHINVRLSDPTRTRWTCEAECSECLGSGWVEDWGAQAHAPCPYGRPLGAVSVGLWWLGRLAWAASWHVGDLWMRRPMWMRRWWWTGDLPF